MFYLEFTDVIFPPGRPVTNIWKRRFYSYVIELPQSAEFCKISTVSLSICVIIQKISFRNVLRILW